MKTLVRPIISEKFQKTAGTILNSLDYEDSKQVKQILADVMERGACLKNEKMEFALGAMLIVYGNILLDRYQTIYGDAGVLKDGNIEDAIESVRGGHDEKRMD